MGKIFKSTTEKKIQSRKSRISVAFRRLPTFSVLCERKTSLQYLAPVHLDFIKQEGNFTMVGGLGGSVEDAGAIGYALAIEGT